MSLKDYVANKARWEQAWEAHKATKEYKEALAKETQRIAGDLSFGILKSHPTALSVAEDHLRFNFERNLGRYTGASAPAL